MKDVKKAEVPSKETVARLEKRWSIPLDPRQIEVDRESLGHPTVTRTRAVTCPFTIGKGLGLLLIAALLSSGCLSGISMGDRLRHGPATTTGYVTALGAQHICLRDLDNRYQRFEVSTSKRDDLAGATRLLGAKTKLWIEDHLVVAWDREGPSIDLRMLEPMDLVTCLPLVSSLFRPARLTPRQLQPGPDDVETWWHSSEYKFTAEETEILEALCEPCICPAVQVRCTPTTGDRQ